jgi:hypothetical protein
MCNIEGCDAKPVAKGLCAKHYMRSRRHGSVDVKHKTGPKPGTRPDLDFHRSLFRDWSPRTIARFTEAMRAMSMAPDEKRIETIKAATRPNGSVNVSKLCELAIIVLAGHLELLECRVCGASAKDGCDCGARYYPREPS